MIFEQALFGYSDGHRLLASSYNIPPKILKVLEPLSDLSGSGYPQNFSEYFTGYFFTEEGFFVLSKTWYAEEMPRPGCVWTQSIFIPIKEITSFSISNVFSRPTVVGEYDNYKSKVELLPKGAQTAEYTSDEKKCILPIVTSIFTSKRPLFIDASTSEQYNNLFPNLWLSLGSNLLKGQSFCTGSLSNRMAEKKSLDFQVVPTAMAKTILRVSKTGELLAHVDNTPEWVNIIANNYVFHKNHTLIDFVNALSITKDSNYVIESCAKIISILEKAKPEFNDIIAAISNLLEHKTKQELFTKAIITFLNKTDNLGNIAEYIDIIKNLVLSDEETLNLINANELFQHLESSLNTNPLLPKEIFDVLTDNEVNQLGIQFIELLAKHATKTSLQSVLGNNYTACNVLIKFYPELSLDKNIWNASRDIQDAVLYEVQTTNKDTPPTLIKQLCEMIFTYDCYEISSLLFTRFGKQVIKIYLDWAQNERDVQRIKFWVNICTCDIKHFTKLLTQSKNPIITEIACEIIDPYLHDRMDIPVSYWADYFKNTVDISNDINLASNFAYFILPLIILSDKKYPDNLVSFAFRTSYNLLSSDNFDYDKWIKLSEIIPKLVWSNNWNKCKRLKKSAKSLGYKLNLDA